MRSIDLNVLIGEKVIPPITVQKRTYSVEEIQFMLNVSRKTAYILATSGKFKAVRAGGKLWVSKESFDKWFNEQEV